MWNWTTIRHWIFLRIFRWRVVSRSHPLRTQAALATVVVVAVFYFGWRFFLKSIPIWIGKLSQLIFQATQAHPAFGRFVHVLINAIPDSAFALLALAGLGYLAPGFIKKLEGMLGVRVFLFFFFGFFGVAAIIINAVNREAQEFKDGQNDDRMGTVMKSVTNIQEALRPKAINLSETERRDHLLESLRDEYIVDHPSIDPEILYGKKMPPAEWMNPRLKAMGEKWQFAQPPPPSSTPTQEAILKTVDIKNAVASVPSKAGDDAKIEIAITVNRNRPLQIVMYQLAGVKQVFADPTQQMQMEDSLWNTLAPLPKGVPLQLPSHNEAIGISIAFNAVKEIDFEQVKAGNFEYYFMCHMIDSRGTTLLDFCSRVNSKGSVTYCRNHNGP